MPAQADEERDDPGRFACDPYGDMVRRRDAELADLLIFSHHGADSKVVLGDFGQLQLTAPVSAEPGLDVTRVTWGIGATALGFEFGAVMGGRLAAVLCGGVAAMWAKWRWPSN